MVPGQNPQLGIKIKSAGGVHDPFWIGNPAAFTQACLLGGTPTAPTSIAGSAPNCVQVTGAAALGFKRDQIPGPGFHRLDFSVFKNFKLTERFMLSFRSEFYNITNHPPWPGRGCTGSAESVTFITGAADAPATPVAAA